MDGIVDLGQQSVEVKVDLDLISDGWTEYERDAKMIRDRYFAEIQALLDGYGIESEAGVISGNLHFSLSVTFCLLRSHDEN